ncbi:hypothetical protein [Clostridium sp. LIBA-8841]|uniref:hypothetical protein n=1 Tax=Clostridium sp. LIBA-8841 TaxID=2987530 RepID=UPI002AC7B48B|nr:hypothetical protein [Clostridium sp. LIBA-8841]MDZ5253837.1 hypothetical protein [Clostridium sp. LIBA-8841]
MITLLNPASLILGLIAWIIPVISIIQHKKHNNRNWGLLSIMSMIACATSLFFQIFYVNYLVKIEDWTAIMDTIGAVVFAGGTLLVITIVLNVITIFIYGNRPVK